MAAINLSDIINGIGSLNQSQGQAANQIASIQNTQAGVAQSGANSIREAGRLNEQAEVVQGMAQLNAQQNAAKAATAFGTNMNAQSEVMTGLGDVLRTLATDYQVKQDRADNINRNDNLLSNPLGWVNALLNGDEANADADAAAQRFQTTSAMVQNLNSLTQQTAQTQAAIAQTTTAATVAGAAKANRELANAQAAQAEVQALGYGAQAVDTMRQAGAAEFNRMTQAFQLQESQQYRIMQQQQMRANLEAKQEDDQFYADTTAQVNIARSAIGLPELSESYIKRVYPQAGEQGQALRDQHMMGMQASQTGTFTIGDTPFEAKSRTLRYNAQLPPSYKPAQTLLKETDRQFQQIVNAANALPKGTGGPETFGLDSGNVKDPQAIKSAYDTVASQIGNTAQQDITAQGTDGPYSMVPISNVLQEFPRVAATPFAQKVLAELAAGGNEQPEPSVIVSRAVAAYQNGDLNFNQTRDGLLEFFNSATAMKNATGGLLQMGLPVQKGFRATLPGVFENPEADTGTWFGPLAQARSIANWWNSDEIEQAEKIYDLTNPTDVTSVLTSAQSSTMARNMRNNTEK